jgi:FdhD protein
MHKSDHSFKLSTVPTYKIYREAESLLSRDVDYIVAEEPFEIRVGLDDSPGEAWVVTMRTPGHDKFLVYGHLWSEGIISKKEDVKNFKLCGPVNEKGNHNTCFVRLDPSAMQRVHDNPRSQSMNSSCGFCGKKSLESLQYSPFKNHKSLVMPYTKVKAAIEDFSNVESVYSKTGGCHACAFVDPNGKVRYFQEDVGRHNALDKLIGQSVIAGEPSLGDGVLILSGRVSYEMVDKAISIGVSSIAAIGAPTSLAIELARSCNLTLIGFVKASGMNIYHLANEEGE